MAHIRITGGKSNIDGLLSGRNIVIEVDGTPRRDVTALRFEADASGAAVQVVLQLLVSSLDIDADVMLTERQA